VDQESSSVGAGASPAPAGERIAEILRGIEVMVGDVLREATEEAARLVSAARRERENILGSAERDAATLVSRARAQADEIAAAARAVGAPDPGAPDRRRDEPPRAGVNLASRLPVADRTNGNGVSSNGHHDVDPR
jgi:cell division septum initiation protein DivIVA